MKEPAREFGESVRSCTVIDRRYGLEAVAEAHRYVQGGHKRGNVVLEVHQADFRVLAA